VQGDYNCGDSGYRDGWWNNVTFKQADGSEVTCATAKDVFDHFHSEPLNMHFGGSEFTSDLSLLVIHGSGLKDCLCLQSVSHAHTRTRT